MAKEDVHDYVLINSLGQDLRDCDKRQYYDVTNSFNVEKYYFEVLVHNYINFLERQCIPYDGIRLLSDVGFFLSKNTYREMIKKIIIKDSYLDAYCYDYEIEDTIRNIIPVQFTVDGYIFDRENNKKKSINNFLSKSQLNSVNSLGYYYLTKCDELLYAFQERGFDSSVFNIPLLNGDNNNTNSPNINLFSKYFYAIMKHKYMYSYNQQPLILEASKEKIKILEK